MVKWCFQTILGWTAWSWKCSESGCMGLWVTWSRRRCPCPWRGGRGVGGTRWSLKVLSNPSHSVVLWFYEVRGLEPLRYKEWAGWEKLRGNTARQHQPGEDWQEKNVSEVGFCFFKSKIRSSESGPFLCIIGNSLTHVPQDCVLDVISSYHSLDMVRSCVILFNPLASGI